MAIDIVVDGWTSESKDGSLTVMANMVSPEYVRTTGHRLLQGREFTTQDDTAAPRVLMINEVLAQRLWPGESALGKMIRVRKDGPLSEVVGVLGNAQYLFLNEKPRAMIWRPLAQAYTSYTTLSVKSTLPATTLAQTLRGLLKDLDPEVVPFDMRTIETHLKDGFALFFVKIAATLAMAIGVLGLLQTIVGLFGVLSYVVSQRTKEIGVRMALGAQRGNVIAGVLRQGLALVAGGLVLGVVLSLVVTRGLTSLLVGVTPNDVVAYAAAGGLLVGLAMLSCYLPALRAARLEPVLALRRDG
jgi:ABC-type antimicrobial peptide transport system permease subunit